MMPRNTFHPLQYKKLINIATASNYLPGKQLLILKHFLKKSKMVRLTLMDNASALFTDLHSKTVMKYKVVLITSINPRVLEGRKLTRHNHCYSLLL
ncbi:unnamed protein product [Brassica oleracea]